MLTWKLRRFFSRVTPLTWVIWLLFLANVRGGGYGQFDFVVAEVDAADLISVIRTGKHYDGNDTSAD
jgi:hypothetical protein